MKPSWARWLRSLRVRAAAVVIAVAVTPLFVVAGASLYEARTGERMTERLRAAAAEVAADPAALEATAARYGAWVRVYDGGELATEAQHARGATVESSVLERLFDAEPPPDLVDFDASLGPVLERDEIRRSRPGQRIDGCRVSTGQRMMMCFAVVALPESDVIVLAQDGVRRSIRALHDLWTQLLGLTLAILPIAIGLAWWLGWRMVRPLEKLRAQMQREVPPTPGTRLALSRPDEFGDLTRAFNDLLERLEEHARDKEAFVADLAHEFKNPVAAVRAAAEALEARPDDPERTRRLARTLHGSSVQLEELVSQFLDLARAEAGFVGESREPVDLAALVRSVTADVEADPRWAELELRAEIEAEATVDGLPWRIETAVRNLVVNACGFAKTRVAVRLRIEDGAAVVEVTDDGPGIADEDRDRIFERFHSRRRGGGGTGLGLAIVRATAIAHGGQVHVRSAVDAGAAFGLRLPRG